MVVEDVIFYGHVFFMASNALIGNSFGISKELSINGVLKFLILLDVGTKWLSPSTD